MIEIHILGHGLFSWQSTVIEGVHVDDLLCFDHDRWLGLVFEPALALKGDPQLVHHGAAEGPLWRESEKKGAEWIIEPYQISCARQQI